MKTANDRARTSVVGLMLRFASWAAVVTLLAAAGCNNNKGGELSSTRPEPTKPNPSQPTGTSPDPSKVPGEPSKVAIDPKNFEVKPGEKIGYKPAAMTTTDLGKKTDDGIKALRDGKAIVKMLYEGPKGVLNGTLDVKVRDPKTYVVEYLLPETEAAPNKLAADGKTKMVFEGRKWDKPKPSKASGTMSPKELDAWITDYPREILVGLQDGSSVWTNVLTGLTNDPNRTTTIEQQEATVNSIKRTIYRVVSRKKGIQGEEVEIVVDGKRWLPLTVKATFHDEHKAPVHILWTANWLFGGKFEDKEFIIPVTNP